MAQIVSGVLRWRNSALEATNSVYNLQIIETGAKRGKSTNPRSHSRKEQSPRPSTSPAQALFRVAGTGSERRIPNSRKVQAHDGHCLRAHSFQSGGLGVA